MAKTGNTFYSLPTPARNHNCYFFIKIRPCRKRILLPNWGKAAQILFPKKSCKQIVYVSIVERKGYIKIYLKRVFKENAIDFDFEVLQYRTGRSIFANAAVHKSSFVNYDVNLALAEILILDLSNIMIMCSILRI